MLTCANITHLSNQPSYTIDTYSVAVSTVCTQKPRRPREQMIYVQAHSQRTWKFTFHMFAGTAEIIRLRKKKDILLDDFTNHSAVRASSFPSSSNGLRFDLSVGGTPCSLCSSKRSTLWRNMPAESKYVSASVKYHKCTLKWITAGQV